MTSQQPSNRLIAASLLFDSDGTLKKNTIVEFSPEGELLNIFYGQLDLDSQSNVEYYNGILIPSMVNAHNHTELSYFEGLIPQGTGLVSFIEHVIKFRNAYEVPERVEKMQIQDRKMWLEGTGAVGDISNNDFTLPVKAESPIYYHTFVEYFGHCNDSDAEQYFAENVQPIVDKAEGLGLAATASPHSTYMVNDKLFKLGANSPRPSVHFMETPSELDFYDKEGEMYDFVTSDGSQPNFTHYGSHPERLVKSLPSNLPLVLVHCTQMRKADIEKVSQHFNDVTFVTCPRSNFYIDKAYPPLELFDRMGVNMAIGTDSLCSNTSYSIASEIEWIARNYATIRLETILKWATEGGAHALGIDNTMGKMKIGTKCGAVLLEGFDLKTLRPINTVTSKRLV